MYTFFVRNNKKYFIEKFKHISRYRQQLHLPGSGRTISLSISDTAVRQAIRIKKVVYIMVLSTLLTFYPSYLSYVR